MELKETGRPNFTARQALVTLGRGGGQLLCIPDEVKTSVSGKNKQNKHGVYVAPLQRPKHLVLTTGETLRFP